MRALIGLLIFTLGTLSLPAQSELSLGLGHSDQILSIALSPDSKLVASTSVSLRSIIVWDVASKRPLRSLDTYADGIDGVVFAADSKSILVLSRDQKLGRFDILTGKKLQELDLGENLLGITTYSYSPATDSFLIGFYTGQYRFVDVKNQKVSPLYGSKRDDGSGDLRLGFSPSGQEFYQRLDGEVKIFRTKDRSLVCEVQSESPNVTTIGFSPDGKLIGLGSGGYFMAPPSGDESFGLQFFDAKSGTLAIDLIPSDSVSPSGDSKGVIDFAFTNKASEIAVVTSEPMLRLFDAKTLKPLENRRLDSSFTSLRVLGSGQDFLCLPYQYSGSTVNSPILSSTAKKTKFEPFISSPNLETFKGRISPDRKRIAFYNEEKIVYVDLSKSFDPLIIPISDKNLADLQFNPKGKSLFLLADETIFEFDPQSQKLLGSPTKEAVAGLGFASKSTANLVSPDGQYTAELLLGSYSSGMSGFRLWSKSAKNPVFGARNEIDVAVFSPDSKWLAVSTFELSVYPLPSGNNPLVLEGKIVSAAFSHDSAYLATAKEESRFARLYSLPDLKPVGTFGPIASRTVAIAMSVNRLLVMTEGGDIMLFDLKSQEKLAHYRVDGDSDWAAWTPKGLFAGTRDILEGKAYFVDGNSIRVLTAKDLAKAQTEEILSLFNK